MSHGTNPGVITHAGGNGVDVGVARSTRAGPWVWVHGAASGPQSASRLGEPAEALQAQALWTEVGEALAASGASPARMVRSDQFFTGWQTVPHYHAARQQVVRLSAPSTSVLVPGLGAGAGTLMMDAWAVADEASAPEPLHPDGLDVPATSHFVPVMRAQGLVFVAGLMAAHGEGDLGGIAPAARVPDGHLWKGNRIQLETRYLIERKLKPALAGAGLSLADVRHARVCLSDLNELPAFNQVWRQAFDGRVPVTTVVPTSRPGFAIEDARIEINLIAEEPGVYAPRALPEATDWPDGVANGLAAGYPAMGRVGDLLVCSGLLAVDSEGAALRAPAGAGHFDSDAGRQMAQLLSQVSALAQQCGVGMDQLVKVFQLHTHLDDLPLAMRLWQAHRPGQLLPITAVGVPQLAVPGCRVQVECWFYAPA